jgi:hypothetical protein
MAMKYEDLQESYFDQASHTNTTVEFALPSFSAINFDRYGVRSDGIHQRYKVAATSTLNSSGISDFEQNTREIQSVSCEISSASDHTFATIKNYQSSDIEGASAVHTITNERGELASAVIVANTSAQEYSHAFEQFSWRDNVHLKVHVTDNHPQNFELHERVLNKENKDHLWT